MVTKAKPGKKFIGSSADDSYGSGAFMESLEAIKNAEGDLFLNQGSVDNPEWVAVHEIIEIPREIRIKPIAAKSIVHDPIVD